MLVSEAAHYTFDVALSFAVEDREAVFAIAKCLRSHGVSVFCVEFETSPLWGDELPQHLVDVYLRWARYAVVFVSVDYRDKLWLRDDLMSPLVRALNSRVSPSAPTHWTFAKRRPRKSACISARRSAL
jgi:hypothetical protein